MRKNLFIIQLCLLAFCSLMIHFNFDQQPHYPESMPIVMALSMLVFLFRNRFIFSTLSLIFYLVIIHCLVLLDFKLADGYRLIWLLNGCLLITSVVYRYYLLNYLAKPLSHLAETAETQSQ
jgi:hypothetical protein